MRARLLLIITLVVVALPCMEVPDWAGITGDSSNDFVVSPTATRASLTTLIATSVTISEANPGGTFEISAESAPRDILWHGAYFTPCRVGIQRK